MSIAPTSTNTASSSSSNTHPIDPDMEESYLYEEEQEHNIMNTALLTSPTIETPTSTEIIQTCSPVVVKNTTSTSSIQHSLLSSNSIPYVPQTLVGGNNDHRRLSILPTFVSVDNSTSHLLLANVPEELLSSEQLMRRRHAADAFDCCPSDNIADKEMSTLSWQLSVDMSTRLNVDMPIIVQNMTRLFSSLTRVSCPDFVAKEREKKLKLTAGEWFTALEFYLQMDVDLFFMKTCSFRHAQPRSIGNGGNGKEGLFCINPPQARYGLKQCTTPSCRICHEPLNLTKRFEPVMNISTNLTHRFVNRYQVILNCDVTCMSTDVIYALTCPCHQFDYVGRTKRPFRHALWHHRRAGLRIIHEFLIGHEIIDLHRTEPRTYLMMRNDAMDLYRHSPRCHVAMQILLDFHPDYWCLVPMTMQEADIDDRIPATTNTSEILSKYTNVIYFQNDATDTTRSKEMTQWCLGHVPAPPPNYRFSKRQIQEQYFFFKGLSDLKEPSDFLDFYNAAIVIAMPNNCLDDLSHSVQALLITHAECKLNMEPSINCIIQPSASHDRGNWCQHLVRPPRPSTVSLLSSISQLNRDT